MAIHARFIVVVGTVSYRKGPPSLGWGLFFGSEQVFTLLPQ
jgi:hypothetical protein